ncbi:MAG: hypothetical protein ABIK36_01825 [Pseudomonadota bacterium]
MDLSSFTELSKPMGALAGAVILGLVAVAAGAIMVFVLRHSQFMRNTDVAQSIFSRVSPPVFYFGIVAPVWTVLGAVFGYQLAGNH